MRASRPLIPKKSSSKTEFVIDTLSGCAKIGFNDEAALAATLVERWLVNPVVRVKLHSPKEGKAKMAAKRKAKAKGKAKKKAKKKGKK